MSLAAASFLMSLALLCGLLGYRSGRLAAVLVGSTAVGGLLSVLLLPAAFALGGWPGIAVLVVLIGGLLLGLRVLLQGDRQAPVGRRWRLASAGAGVVAAPLLALTLACLLAVLTRPAPGIAPDQAMPSDPWQGLRQFGAELGGLSGEVLATLPLVGERAIALQALHAILAAPPERLAAVAERHGLLGALERPSVQAALADDALLADIRALGQGALGKLPGLMDSPHLHALRSDASIRDLIVDLDLRVVVDELQRPAEGVARR